MTLRNRHSFESEYIRAAKANYLYTEWIGEVTAGNTVDGFAEWYSRTQLDFLLHEAYIKNDE